ncbi:hypothetical protein RRG08_005940 [Elysia crispata]|uniref:Uncharacterized protein n=1 Tax=Elysia crispata TaxID=231223 RepID=A0AAE1AZT8_9GAST|nr:hypothetical protein RRG08_005940 [Elysia crispata]
MFMYTVLSYPGARAGVAASYDRLVHWSKGHLTCLKSRDGKWTKWTISGRLITVTSGASSESATSDNSLSEYNHQQRVGVVVPFISAKLWSDCGWLCGGPARAWLKLLRSEQTDQRRPVPQMYRLVLDGESRAPCFESPPSGWGGRPASLGCVVIFLTTTTTTTTTATTTTSTSARSGPSVVTMISFHESEAWMWEIYTPHCHT